MTQTLYARPYDISIDGFLFESVDDFTAKASKLTNCFGQPIEEFEISFIDGDDTDCALADAWGLNQANFSAFIRAAELWDDYQKLRFIIAVGECGYSFDPDMDHPNDLDVDIYELDNLKELAEQFIEDGLYGPIPECLVNYIDTDAIARDLAFEYSEITIAGKQFVYTCR